MKLGLKHILLVIISGILLVSFLQYILTNELATRGAELTKRLQEENALRQEQLILTSEAAHLTALTRVSDEGERMGLVVVSNYLTLRPVIVAQRLSANETIH